jgi:hypothetical protein
MLNGEKIRRVVHSAIDEITFSVDGPNQKIYERYRQTGDFNRVLSIMSEFVEERNRLGREVPFINWRYIIFKWNDRRRTMKKTVKLAKKIGVDRLTWEITEHPADSKSNKYQIGTPAWKKIYFEIWDTSQIGNAITGNRFMAELKGPSADIVTGTNQPKFIKVKSKNIGGALWLNHTFSGRRLVRLGAQLFSNDRELINLNFARSPINKPLKRGEVQVIEMVLPPINKPGDYWIKFDMVSEGIDWFESGGSPVIWEKLSVSE